MKYAVGDPVEAARRFGGATWEPGGWWTSATPTAGAMALPAEQRDAIYVPTVQRCGMALSSVLPDWRNCAVG